MSKNKVEQILELKKQIHLLQMQVEQQEYSLTYEEVKPILGRCYLDRINGTGRFYYKCVSILEDNTIITDGLIFLNGTYILNSNEKLTFDRLGIEISEQEDELAKKEMDEIMFGK